MSDNRESTDAAAVTNSGDLVSPTCVFFDSQSSRMWTGHESGAVISFSSFSAVVKHESVHKSSVVRILLSAPDSNHIISIGLDRRILAFRRDDGTFLKCVSILVRPPLAIAMFASPMPFSPECVPPSFAVIDAMNGAVSVRTLRLQAAASTIPATTPPSFTSQPTPVPGITSLVAESVAEAVAAGAAEADAFGAAAADVAGAVALNTSPSDGSVAGSSHAVAVLFRGCVYVQPVPTYPSKEIRWRGTNGLVAGLALASADAADRDSSTDPILSQRVLAIGSVTAALTPPELDGWRGALTTAAAHGVVPTAAGASTSALAPATAAALLALESGLVVAYDFAASSPLFAVAAPAFVRHVPYAATRQAGLGALDEAALRPAVTAVLNIADIADDSDVLRGGVQVVWADEMRCVHALVLHSDMPRGNHGGRTDGDGTDDQSHAGVRGWGVAAVEQVSPVDRPLAVTRAAPETTAYLPPSHRPSPNPQEPPHAPASPPALVHAHEAAPVQPEAAYAPYQPAGPPAVHDPAGPSTAAAALPGGMGATPYAADGYEDYSPTQSPPLLPPTAGPPVVPSYGEPYPPTHHAPAVPATLPPAAARLIPFIPKLDTSKVGPGGFGAGPSLVEQAALAVWAKENANVANPAPPPLLPSALDTCDDEQPFVPPPPPHEDAGHLAHQHAPGTSHALCFRASPDPGAEPGRDSPAPLFVHPAAPMGTPPPPVVPPLALSLHADAAAPPFAPMYIEPVLPAAFHTDSAVPSLSYPTSPPAAQSPAPITAPFASPTFGSGSFGGTELSRSIPRPPAHLSSSSPQVAPPSDGPPSSYPSTGAAAPSATSPQPQPPVRPAWFAAVDPSENPFAPARSGSVAGGSPPHDGAYVAARGTECFATPQHHASLQRDPVPTLASGVDGPPSPGYHGCDQAPPTDGIYGASHAHSIAPTPPPYGSVSRHMASPQHDVGTHDSAKGRGSVQLQWHSGAFYAAGASIHLSSVLKPVPTAYSSDYVRPLRAFSAL